MQKILQQLTSKHIAAILFFIIISAIAYYQYQAYETERKLDIERKEISERMREFGRLSSEQMKKHPLTIPDDPLAPEDNPLGSIPSDAEEMAQINLWHQAPPEQRKKLIPTPEKLPTLKPEQLLKEQVQQAKSEQLSDDPEPNPIQQQAMLAIQKQALAAKSKQN